MFEKKKKKMNIIKYWIGVKMEQNIRLKEKKSADEQIRLNKFLSDAGYCSRMEADRLVE